MQYQKYFKPGQRVLLKTLAEGAHSEGVDSYTTSLVRCEQNLFDLTLPYRQTSQEMPFETETAFEVLSEAFGLGLRFVGQFIGKTAHDLLRIRADGHLELYYRRHHPRANTSVGLLYTRGKGGLRAVHAQWAKSVEVIGDGENASQLPPFNRCQVNLSAGGVRFPVKTPVEMADFFIIFLDIEDGEPPVCCLGEVAWIEATVRDGARTTGIRFANILDSDQKRIERFVQDRAEKEDNNPEEDGPDSVLF